jgi:O-antigen/teichoic acid export membrane protein
MRGMGRKAFRLAGTFNSSSFTILKGRACYQLGVFAFAVLPSARLSNTKFEQYSLAFIFPTLFVLSTGVAFHSWIARERTTVASPLRGVVVLGLVGCILSVPFYLAVAGTASLHVEATIGFGAIVQSMLLFRATSAAQTHEFKTSARIEATLGLILVMFAAVTFLTGLGQTPLEWAVAWCFGSLLTLGVSQLLRTARVEVPAHSAKALSTQLWGARTLILLGLLSSTFNRADYLVMTVVSTELQTTRYALAARITGVLLVGLGSLNNSLYLQQVALKSETGKLFALSQRWSKRLTLASLATVPFLLGFCLLAQSFVTSWHLRLVPVALVLGVSIAFYAATLPWAHALNATGRETTWMQILAAGTASNIAMVLAFGHFGATAVAGCWLCSQILVAVLTIGSLRRA